MLSSNITLEWIEQNQQLASVIETMSINAIDIINKLDNPEVTGETEYPTSTDLFTSDASLIDIINVLLTRLKEHPETMAHGIALCTDQIPTNISELEKSKIVLKALLEIDYPDVADIMIHTYNNRVNVKDKSVKDAVAFIGEPLLTHFYNVFPEPVAQFVDALDKNS